MNPPTITRIVNQNRSGNRPGLLGRLQLHLERRQKTHKKKTTSAHHDYHYQYHVGTLTKSTATLD
jgi:hypothetical protein